MNRQFSFNIALLLGINGLIKPLYLFGIDRTIQNTLPEGDYGLYFTFFNLSFVLSIINDPGVQNFNTTYIGGQKHLLSKTFASTVQIRLISGFLFLLATLASGFALGYNYDVIPLLFLVAFNHFLASLALFFRSNLSAIGLYSVDSLLSGLDKFLMILLLGLFLLHPSLQPHLNIYWFVALQGTAFLLTLLLALFLVLKNTGQLQIPKWRLSTTIIRRSLPYALVVFLMLAYTRIDAIMIERLLPSGQIEAGYYAAGYRLLDATNSVGFLFASLLLPMFAKLHTQKKSFTPLLSLSLNHIIALSGWIALVFITYRNPIIQILYPSIDSSVPTILLYLMLTFICLAIGYIYGTLLTATGYIHKMNWLFAGAVIINIVLNVFLIPSEKSIGAAKATFYTQFFVCVSQIILANRWLGLKNALNTWKKPLIYLCALSIISSLLNFVGINLYYGALFSFLLCCGTAFFIDLIQPHKWLNN